MKLKIPSILKSRLSSRQKKSIRSFLTELRTFGRGNNLDKLAEIYQTDKYGQHFYTPHYSRHFKHLKYKKVKVLEIGVGGYENPDEGGNSLRMWRRYFPFGKIYSIDIHEKSCHNEKRIKIFRGSQVDEAFLMNIMKEIKEPDIIIDDGSHLNDQVLSSFKILFPRLKEGGIYVIEDTQTSYWKEFGGESPEDVKADTTMNFLKKLTDGLNYKEFILAGYTPSYLDQNITSLHFYHNLVFIYKGKNEEESNLVKNHQLNL